MMEEPLNCPFCGSKIHRVVSMARSFKPPREWLEFQHEEPTTNCFLYNRIGRVIAVTADSYNRLGEFLTAWNTRADGWRGIDDAAKDGNCILGWGNKIGIHQVYWDEDQSAYKWRIDDGSISYAEYAITMYQPLPTPPRAQAQKPAEETRSEVE